MDEKILSSQGICVEKVSTQLVYCKSDNKLINDSESDGSLKEFIDSLLSKEIYNDIVFDHTFITMTFKTKSVRPFLYRKLWNNLQHIDIPTQTSIQSDDTHDTVFTMNASFTLSECLRFIQLATPPIMHAKLKDAKLLFDDVISMLQFFLIANEKYSDNHQNEYNTSMFIKEMHMYPFNTNRLSVERIINRSIAIRNVRKYDLSQLIALIDAGNMPIDKFINSNITDRKSQNCFMQFSFSIATNNELNLMRAISTITPIISIDNIYEEHNMIYISGYLNSADDDNITDTNMMELFKPVYCNIFRK